MQINDLLRAASLATAFTLANLAGGSAAFAVSERRGIPHAKTKPTNAGEGSM